MFNRPVSTASPTQQSSASPTQGSPAPLMPGSPASTIQESPVPPTQESSASPIQESSTPPVQPVSPSDQHLEKFEIGRADETERKANPSIHASINNELGTDDDEVESKQRWKQGYALSPTIRRKWHVVETAFTEHPNPRVNSPQAAQERERAIFSFVGIDAKYRLPHSKLLNAKKCFSAAVGWSFRILGFSEPDPHLTWLDREGMSI